MTGRQKKNNAGNSSQNPFYYAQLTYFSLFSDTKSKLDDEFEVGKNDEMVFRASMPLEESALSNSAILQRNDGKKYFNYHEKSFGGFLKSVRVVDDKIDNKPVKQIEVTFFDPEAVYDNPFEDIDGANQKNGTVCGATYKVKTAFTLKGKEMLSLLFSAMDYSDNPESFYVSIVPAKSPQSGYTENIVIEGKKIFNFFVKQGEQILRPRFVDLNSKGWEKRKANLSQEQITKIESDVFNQEYTEIFAKYEGTRLRNHLDEFFEDYINNVFKVQVHERLFLPKLRDMGYDLVENGTDAKGNVKMKYVSLNADSADSIVDFDELPDYEGEKDFKPALESVMAGTESDDNYDDLPF